MALCCPLTIGGGNREGRECRRGHGNTVCARGSNRTLLRGPSTSPLDLDMRLPPDMTALRRWRLWRVAVRRAARTVTRRHCSIFRRYFALWAYFSALSLQVVAA